MGDRANKGILPTGGQLEASIVMTIAFGCALSTMPLRTARTHNKSNNCDPTLIIMSTSSNPAAGTSLPSLPRALPPASSAGAKTSRPRLKRLKRPADGSKRPDVQVRLLGARKAGDHVDYELEITWRGWLQWRIGRRYSEFVDLDKQLRLELDQSPHLMQKLQLAARPRSTRDATAGAEAKSKGPLPPLPSKTLLTSKFSEDLLRKREAMLS